MSCPSGIDGSTNKVSISLPAEQNKKNLSEKRAEFVEKRKKMLALIKTMLETNDNAVVNHIANEQKPRKETKKKPVAGNVEDLSTHEKELLFKRIMSVNGLNLFQKVNIFEKLKLHVKAPAAFETELSSYLSNYNVQTREDSLNGRITRLSDRYKFGAVHKLNQYKSKRRDKLTSLLRAVDFSEEVPKRARPTNGRADSEKVKDRARKISLNGSIGQAEKKKEPLKAPIKCTNQINHVVFCTGEYAHLVIVCTENRLLIWNLLTLRLKSSLRLSVEKIVVDLYTNLVAVFTHTNEMFVFLPNTPIPLYQRKDLPKIHGAAWIPRRFPKPHSLTVNWQAVTELYLLSDKQVRKHLIVARLK